MLNADAGPQTGTCRVAYTMVLDSTEAFHTSTITVTRH
jgi:hypothetical protein